jgi:uncharacterized protein (TIGR02145 family)
MKTKALKCSLFLLAVFYLLSPGCQKDEETITGTVTDVDGNVYKTIKIGTQWWMAENLKTTRFNDGTPIPLVTEDTAWSNFNAPGYCWYKNDEGFKKDYGALYNGFAINSSSLAPKGWHLPNITEWDVLINYLGGYSVAANKMRTTGIHEEGTGLWHAPNAGATNESGFSGNPGGYRNETGKFDSIGDAGFFWSYENKSRSPKIVELLDGQEPIKLIKRIVNNLNGYSVRCVKD